MMRVVRCETLYKGRVIRLIREELERNGRRMVRETVLHPGAVVILPLLDRSRIVLLRQYRRAIRRTLLELPAGTLDRRESPLACAKRELAEETGYRARRWRRLTAFYAAPGFISERMTLFLAEGLTRGTARPDPDEELRVVILSLREAMRRVRSGALCDAKTLIGILLAHHLANRSSSRFPQAINM